MRHGPQWEHPQSLSRFRLRVICRSDCNSLQTTARIRECFALLCGCKECSAVGTAERIDMKRAPALPSFDHQPIKYAGPSADEVLQLRKEFLNPGIFLYYKKPLMLVEGKMQIG